MKLNKTYNTIRNMWWGIINKIVNLFFPFFTRTFVIKILGTEYLGLSGLFTSILSVLSLTELGISSAIVFSMYKPIAEDDRDTICALMGLYRKVYRIIGCIVGALGLAILPFLKSLIKGETPQNINIYILYSIYLFNTVIGYFLFAYKNCLFAAHQREDMSHKVQMICNGCQYITQIILLLLTRNYYGYIIALPLFTVLQNITNAYFATKNYPEYVCKGKVKASIIGGMKKQIGGLVIGKINVTVRTALDSMFISTFLGLVTVGMYSNYFFIVSSLMGIISLLSSAMVAGVGNSIALNSVQKNYYDFRKFTFMSQWLVGFCAVCVLCLIQPFMRVWVGEKLMFCNMMAIICAIYLYVANIGLIRGVYSSALGLWWDMRIYSILDTGINFVLNLLFVSFWGAYGIISATAIALFVYGIPWATYILFNKYFGKDKYIFFMKELFGYELITVFIGALTYFICNVLPITNTWLILICRMAICVVIPNMMYALFYHKNEMFYETIDFVRNIICSYFERYKNKGIN